MPRSLSAEHLGTADQYYWDSFWSVAGIDAASQLLRECGHVVNAEKFRKEAGKFSLDIEKSLVSNELRLHRKVIPATPTRLFDESAIGSACCVYPLGLYGAENEFASQTISALAGEFVDENGFFHPFIHSGYNPYLTVQIAHSMLCLGRKEEAWKIAETILRQTVSPYSLPEAIHPFSGGGAMGDGHHGWAAAEIVLFLRAALVREEGDRLILFDDGGNGAVRSGKDIHLSNIPTSFGHFSCSLRHESRGMATVEFDTSWRDKLLPSEMEIHLPFATAKVVAIPNDTGMAVSSSGEGTIIRCSAGLHRLLLTLQERMPGNEK